VSGGGAHLHIHWTSYTEARVESYIQTILRHEDLKKTFTGKYVILMCFKGSNY